MTFGQLNRRDLLKNGSLLAGVPFIPFLKECSPGGARGGYGPIVEKKDALIYLPAGFGYAAFSPRSSSAKMATVKIGLTATTRAA
jgi:hypothetical protein